jgi:integrase
MLMSKSNDSTLSLQPLQAVRFHELHPEVREALRDQNQFIRSACTRMVAYVTLADQVGPSEVTIDRLKQPDVLEAAYQYGRTISYLVGSFRYFLRSTGNGNALPGSRRRFARIHPVITEWITARNPRPDRRGQLMRACMEFLTWLREEQFPMYDPSEIPVCFLMRDHLVGYRRHVLLQGTRKNLKYSTMKRNMQHVVAWVRWMCGEGKIGELDTTGLAIRTSPSRTRCLPSHMQLSTVLTDVIQNADVTYAVLFLILLVTGARPIELLNLTWNRVDSNKRCIFLQSKVGPGRWIPIPPVTWSVFEDYVIKRFHNTTPSASDHIFVNRYGRPLTYNIVAYVFAQARRRTVDIDGMMAFRHRFATDCYQANMPPRVFQYVMGHKGLSEMIRYQHENPSLLTSEICRAFEDGVTFK